VSGYFIAIPWRRAGPVLEGGVEVQFEPHVLRDGIVRNFQDVDLVFAFEVNDGPGVLLRK
jgi:hypothetical protein